MLGFILTLLLVSFVAGIIIGILVGIIGCALINKINVIRLVRRWPFVRVGQEHQYGNVQVRHQVGSESTQIVRQS